MNLSRKDFFTALGMSAAAMALPGCIDPCKCAGVRGKIALQLYSLNAYLGGRKDKDGKVIVPARGLEKGLEDVAKIGYQGVEFAGYYGFNSKQLKKMLDDNGLVACGTHVGCDAYGLDTKAWTYNPDVLKQTCEFNLGYGNSVIICPGGGNFPPGCSWSTGQGGEPCKPSQAIDDHTKKLVEYYNKVAVDAAKMGCKIGLHNHTWEHAIFMQVWLCRPILQPNHTWEHAIFMQDGTSFWDYFFTNTDKNVCMEQDVGWTTCAGDTIKGVNPIVQYTKYPHRSPTLHAKENGMGKNVTKFDAILGQPGQPGATPVDWDGLLVAAEADGVEWWVVECERHFEDLSAVTPSYKFLKAKGLN